MNEVGRIVFFGTPDFAVPTLDALCRAGLAPELVVTQPARPAGRHRRLVEPPVATYARERGLELSQPERVRSVDFLARVGDVGPAAAVVVAFGQIFPAALLQLPALGCVNLHASLLPRHRGAAPIQAAIAAGDERTGVTTMLMDEGLDTGPMLETREIPIGPRDTAGDLAPRLARLGAPLMISTLRALAAGTLEPVPQDDSLATSAPRLRRADGRLEWSEPATRLERRVRAYSPWPGTFAMRGDERIKVHAAELAFDVATQPAGVVAGVSGNALVVGCGDGCLALTRVQRPGRRAVSGAEFANGAHLEIGDRFDR